MSTGQWIGAVLGAIVGFLIGGWYGAVYGAIIGYTIGGYIDPVKPDVKQPGAPAPLGLQVMTNVIGNPIFDVLGTAKITGQLLFFGKEFNNAVWYRPSKGVRAISGYQYYASWALGICIGEVDCLYTVFRDQDPVWEGELTRPASGGEATIQIPGIGTMVFYFGTDDQMPNSNAGQLLPDPTLNTGHRHLCWAFFNACFMNEYNRMPSMTFVVRKTLPLFSEATSQIAIYDTNPAHAIWHALINKAGLPEDWVHSVDFLAVAATLYAEGRGISILFDTHQPAISYIEAINDHVDNILRYGSDGKFHPKLIRYDYVPSNLPVVNESILLEEPTFSRRSWIDTINEVKVQYSEIKREFSLTVTKSGSGTGTITSSPAGIDCGSDCAEFYAAGTTVILTATPDANNLFVGWSGDGTGTVTRTVVIDGNKVVNAEFDDYLIGWYKLDEGGGDVVHNYANPTIIADKFPDLTVTLNPAGFWNSKPGFGTSIPSSVAKAVWTNEFSTLVAGAGSFGCFVYINGKATNDYPQFYNCQDGIGDLGDSRLLEQNGSIPGYGFINFGGFRGGAIGNTIDQLPYAANLNRWMFYFTFKHLIGGIWKSFIAIIKDDGTIVYGNSFYSLPTSPLIIKQVRLFRYYASTIGYSGYFNGSLGDIMIWKGIHFTLADGKFQQVYDNLRSRYGMAARSGW